MESKNQNKNASCQIDSNNDTKKPVQVSSKIAKAARDVWNACIQLSDLLWDVFSDDFVIIEEQMERDLPSMYDDDNFDF